MKKCDICNIGTDATDGLCDTCRKHPPEWEDLGHHADCIVCNTSTDGMCSTCKACVCLECLSKHECNLI